jgi:transposase
VVDRQGIPLAVGITGANRPDDTVFAALVDAVEPIQQPRGRPRQRPQNLHADKGYDNPHCRQTLRQRGIQARIARKGQESKTRLGRYRWVAERTLAWLNRFRRLPIRDERRDDLHQAFLDLGCALICLHALAGRFCKALLG